MVEPAASDSVERHVTRRVAIGQRSLIVLDGLFPERSIASLYQFLEQLQYQLFDVDSEATAYARHWNSELPLEMATGAPVLKRCVQVASDLHTPDRLRLMRAHSNLHLYGDMQFPHIDSADGVTAIYYANPEWKESWFGETVFYDESREPVCTVAPKPGRLAVFDGAIVHRAGVPSRECYVPRISVAFKFDRV